MEDTLNREKEGEPHWVAQLFPPRFTALDLLENSLDPGTRPPLLLSEKLAGQRTERVQEIYRGALRELQEGERQNRRDRLAKRMVWEPQRGTKVEMSSNIATTTASTTSPAFQNSTEPASKEERAREVTEPSIWSAQELSILRQEMRQGDSERRRLETRLAEALEEIEKQRGERALLEQALESRERDLASARQQNERGALHIQTLQGEAGRRDARLEALAREVREKAADYRGLAQELQKARSEIQELTLHNRELTAELGSLRQEQEAERLRQEELAQVQRETAVRRLQRDLEAAQSELAVEKQRHGRSLSALELLRRHFASLPAQEIQDTFTAKFAQS
ncbi:coiled-coil domain-containing protein 160 isoform X2 [Polyodon spathula]|nr:coiled-coil domain-containing protein 160 isoform X2 [Polyodon spathula]XP_041111973.1 coiled-coil domain-containing protein 160 isoform X2 [Polyodon spathula]